MFFLFSNYFAVDTASAIAIALMTFGTMYPMSVYSGKVLLQVMVVFQYACLKLAMFFYQIIKINVFFCQIMKFLATGGSCWRWSQTISSEICVVRTRWNYVGVQNRHKWVFIYLYIRQEHKWETSLIIFQVKTILVIISLDTYFPLINVFWLLYNPVMIVFLFPVLELVRLLNFKLKNKKSLLIETIGTPVDSTWLERLFPRTGEYIGSASPYTFSTCLS